MVYAYIPFLLGLDVLGREELVAVTVFHRLARNSVLETEKGNGFNIYVDDCFIPIKRARSNYCYVLMEISTHVYFTTAQLHRLNRQLYHPSPQQMINLLKKSKLEKQLPKPTGFYMKFKIDAIFASA